MSSPPFKNVIKKRAREGNQFTFELFRSIFSGKLIFCYNSVVDINWLKQQYAIGVDRITFEDMLEMLGLGPTCKDSKI